MSLNNKPVIVLCGWLGCRPRNLRRFTEMYNHIGYDTILQIGSPKSVIVAMLEGPPTSLDMKHLAIDILKELQAIQPPYYIFHVFSNNGCFLWEWIRYLLYESGDIEMQGIDRQKLLGIIFDSSPAYYDGKIDMLQSALQYVPSLIERNDLLDMVATLDPNVVEQRCHNFWNGLCNDTVTNIPELYVYSQEDKLASANHVEKLIEHRKDLIGKRKIWKHKFIDSEHCGHLLKYPNEYNGLVQRFLSFCIREGVDDKRLTIIPRL